MRHYAKNKKQTERSAFFIEVTLFRLLFLHFSPADKAVDVIGEKYCKASDGGNILGILDRGENP